MKKFALTLAAALLICSASSVFAIDKLCVVPVGPCVQPTDSQVLNMIIPPILRLSLIEDNLTLAIDCHDLGADEFGTATHTTQYKVATNFSDTKVVGKLQYANMSAGMTLKAAMTCPAPAVSTGMQVLTTTAKNMVTGISHVKYTGDINYLLEANMAAAVGNHIRTVEYTIQSM